MKVDNRMCSSQGRVDYNNIYLPSYDYTLQAVDIDKILLNVGYEQ